MFQSEIGLLLLCLMYHVIFSGLINYIVTRHKEPLLTLIVLLMSVRHSLYIRSTRRNVALLSAAYNDDVINNHHDGLTGRWNERKILNAVIVIIIVVDSSLRVWM